MADARDIDAEVLAAVEAERMERVGELLMRHYAPKLSGYLHKLVNPSAAEDLVADTLLVVIEHLRARRFKGEAQLSTYMHQIALNKLAKSSRSFADRIFRRDRVDSDYLDFLIADHQEDGPHQPDDEKVAGVLATLRPRDRAVIVMHAEEGLPHRTIAKVLGISEAASKKTYSRAILRMQEALKIT